MLAFDWSDLEGTPTKNPVAMGCVVSTSPFGSGAYKKTMERLNTSNFTGKGPCANEMGVKQNKNPHKSSRLFKFVHLRKSACVLADLWLVDEC
jgi:hypothetical protein